MSSCSCVKKEGFETRDWTRGVMGGGEGMNGGGKHRGVISSIVALAPELAGRD